MFRDSSRYQLAFALSAILSVSTVLSAAAIDVDAEAALSASSAPQAQTLGIAEPAGDAGDRLVLPYPQNRAAGENMAPTRYNKTIDRGDTD
jgi:hypothetical protein